MLAEAGRAPLAIHGPVHGFDPASRDKQIVGLAWRRCMSVLDVATILDPDVIVFHSSFNPCTYGGDEERWRDRTVRFWELVLDHLPNCRIRVVLENIHDVEPGPLASVINAVDHPRFGLCLDVGHYNVFSRNTAIEDYVRPFAGKLMHVHMHDNDGERDRHFVPGKGQIRFAPIIAELMSNPAPWTLTVECLNIADNAAAAAWVESRFRSRPEPVHCPA
jgi:sugar phosphate isomerase/epimerase